MSDSEEAEDGSEDYVVDDDEYDDDEEEEEEEEGEMPESENEEKQEGHNEDVADDDDEDDEDDEDEAYEEYEHGKDERGMRRPQGIEFRDEEREVLITKGDKQLFLGRALLYKGKNTVLRRWKARRATRWSEMPKKYDSDDEEHINHVLMTEICGECGQTGRIPNKIAANGKELTLECLYCTRWFHAKCMHRAEDEEESFPGCPTCIGYEFGGAGQTESEEDEFEEEEEDSDYHSMC